MENNKKSLVIDGNYLMFQSFYATYRGEGSLILSNSFGVPTNAIQAFMMQFLKLIKFVRPDSIFVAFDAKGPTKRHEIFSEYKSGRTKAPDILYPQFDWIKRILSGLNVVWQEKLGDEADDLIATYCSKVNGKKYVFSADNDLLQLVDENVTILRKDKTNYKEINKDNFFQIFKFLPNQLTSYKGLKGDSSDNLPGVFGIGEKTAISLLEKYNNFENIYKNLENNSDLTKSVKNKLINGYQTGLMSYNLSILNCDVENFETNLEFYKLQLNYNNAMDILMELELSVVINELRKNF
ncbi:MULTISPECIES: 5'-3' exonuclease [unclassified Mycoplasma]|uniref:5'-3' exonuclease n=1 Tax=unclassified Mycoplasma TaxID=2683645 RepID=UPI00197BE68D|nr:MULTISPECIES: 5'-3' exonuclease [unclassified Mycoplasma]MBN4084528.1 5'-3' exonuclease [Mycoplasma sp. CSL10166]MBU4693006.1 5'-3' exonuclease [Mycoplasma sp. CSL7491-lung]